MAVGCYNTGGMPIGETELAALRPAVAAGGLARAASLIAVGTVASRALGLVRDVLIAALFGATSTKSAFVIAYSLPFFIQRLFLGGTLSIVFIPAIAQLLVRGDEEETRRVVTSTLNLVLVIGLGMVAVGVVAAPLLVPVAAPGYLRTNPEVLTTAIGLTRVMFISMVFLALSGFATGFLNAHRQFATPAMAPVVFNLVIIGSVLLLAPRIGIYGVAVSFLLGWAAQFLVQLPAARHAGLRWSPRVDLTHPAIREMGRLAVPAMLGLAVIEINSNVGRFFASFLPAQPGVDYVAVLDYAFQLVQAPVAVFAVSLATALFPTMARHAAGSAVDALRETTSLGIRGVLVTMIPVMTAMLVASDLIVRVIFQRGAFAPAATHAVALGLVGYAVGTVPYAAYYIVTRTYYALHDTRTPVRIGVYMMFLNALGDYVLMQVLGHTGIALATSLVAITNVGWLLWMLRSRLGGVDGRSILRTAGRTALAAVAMAAVMLGTFRLLAPLVDSARFAGALSELALALAAGGVVYLAACRLLGVRELALAGALRRDLRG
ncbi:MAG TPA: murein biosynthesis integral membrane protein MurJ [bacterium]|nr:murein biosynthesis integral membrane protein MurJ [bacterium]